MKQKNLLSIHLLVLVPLMMFSWKVSGQEQDTVAVEEKPSPKIYREPAPWAVYGEGVLMANPTPDRHQLSSEIGLGVKVGPLTVGGFIHTFHGDIQRILVFPNEFNLYYKYGGGYVGLQFLDQKRIFSELKLKVGHGDMVWQRSDNRRNLDRDTFWVGQPELQIGYKTNRYFQVFFLCGYRFIKDLNIIKYETSDFSGVILGLGLKAGIFK